MVAWTDIVDSEDAMVLSVGEDAVARTKATVPGLRDRPAGPMLQEPLRFKRGYVLEFVEIKEFVLGEELEPQSTSLLSPGRTTLRYSPCAAQRSRK